MKINCPFEELLTEEAKISTIEFEDCSLSHQQIESLCKIIPHSALIHSLKKLDFGRRDSLPEVNIPGVDISYTF